MEDWTGESLRHRVRATRAPLEAVRTDHPLGVVLTLGGELDLATGARLREVLDPAIRGTGAVVIDLSGLRFIDSSGLHLLVQAEQQLRDSGRQLVLVRGSGAVHRVFELTQLDLYFTWCDSPSTAFGAPLERRIESGRMPKPLVKRRIAVELDGELGGAMRS